ncbi:conserved hypothetical protein [Cellulomonas flavigena DSM 20109]|uniref:NUDIX hydrolase n=1 Tax=Cellulomonas flavigena (strain ATCC 482 / DSM 20109 / BCRC 11376 / JCM 18109 / NBRC 3775 / NCIMB 8073 / NRS 134) TaxID=446466 RepID=D5UEM5_CELFN|nr:hypothetical protein [Cellulomonas flavigena]ADG74685.1 conserved hypothetical protein [Cellulomonas flavigena DSM 20109]
MSGWSDTTVVLVVVGVILVLAWLVWVRASRLDRLHRKVGASRAVVDAQLVRRATVAAELATSGLLDPASSLVVGEAAWGSLTAGRAGDVPTGLLPADLREQLGASAAVPDGLDRSQVESDLTAALAEILDDPDEVAVLAEDPEGDRVLVALAAAWYRVQLARRFHNEAVAQTQRVRHGALVRLLRLAGHAPEPRTLELDDSWPHGLPRPGEQARAARPGASAPPA